MRLNTSVCAILIVGASFSGCREDADSPAVAATPAPSPTVAPISKTTPTAKPMPITGAPVVSSTHPIQGGGNVLTNRKLTATFSEALNPVTLNPSTFTLMQGNTLVPGSVSVVGNVATFKPNAALAANTTFVATLTTWIKDVNGKSLAANKTWSFTTGAVLDTDAPSVLTTAPLDNGTNAPLNRSLGVSFSEAVDPASITGTTFTVMQGTTPVPGASSAVGSVASFKPTSSLLANTLYVARITVGAKDMAGNALAADKTWSFTTGSALAAGPAPVELGTAGNFVILSKTGITNVATSVIKGNIGTSPITGASLVGLDCIQVAGTIYAVDPTGPACATTDSTYLTTAIGDMEIAYTDAAGRTSPDTTEFGAGEIGGQTIAAGLHKWGTSVFISTDVKLSGGASDVWIFQIAGDITQASGKKVLLEGGAQAKNVFWQVAGQVNIGTTATFEGTLLSKTLVALKTGATLNGRALAQTAVTLESNTVGLP